MPWETVDISSVWEGDTVRVDGGEPFIVRELIARRFSTLLVIDEHHRRRDIHEPRILERRKVEAVQGALLLS
ncbi:hypothetical protein DEDE109153_18400 [Deinococcus deserti]